MIKLFAVDLDDTLLRDGNIISKEDKQAIRDLEESGVKVVIASGRSEPTLKDVILELGLEKNKHVGVNGALVLDLNGKNEFSKYIDRDTYVNLIERLRSENREFFCYCDGGLMYEHVDKLRPQVEYFHSAKALIKGDVMSIPQCPRVNTYYGDEKELAYVRSICPEGLYSTANSGILDYMPIGLNKFSGLELVLKEYGIDKNDVACIGDQESDLDMFNNCGYSFAVSNCDDFAREAADVVLPRSHNENGVAYAIYKYLLKDEDKLSKI